MGSVLLNKENLTMAIDICFKSINIDLDVTDLSPIIATPVFHLLYK